MTANREIDDISEEEFVGFSREELVGFSREELGIHSDLRLRSITSKNFCVSCRPRMDKNLESNEYSALFSGDSWAYKYPQ